jgi:hypothetical protein
MKKLLYILGLLTLSFSTYGQISYNVINGLAFIGEGDYKGYNFGNSLSINVKGLQINPSINFTISSNSKKGYEEMWHNSSFVDFKLPVLIKPIKTKKIGLFLGGGICSRVRNEILPYHWYFEVNQNGDYTWDIDYENNTSIDIGYTISTIIEYYTQYKIGYGLNISMDTYNKGTQLFIIGFSLIYQIKE